MINQIEIILMEKYARNTNTPYETVDLVTIFRIDNVPWLAVLAEKSKATHR